MKKFAALALAASMSFIFAAAPAFAKKRAPHQETEQKEPEKAAYETPFPTKMNWTLSTINGKRAPAEATLNIDENLRGTGVSGCNSWSAALYPIRGHRLAMGPVAITKKTCGKEIDGFERQYLTILHSGPHWDLQGSTLTVKVQNQTLVFNRGL
ncbi:MAG: META domain-containing protein [Hyphomicrobiales bacterium]|nr:META domain-containing protein [Hyphomicrobiales bacterium]